MSSQTHIPWYIQIIAIILFIGIFLIGLYFGHSSVALAPQSAPRATSTVTVATSTLITGVTFICPNHSYVSAMFYRDGVKLLLSDGRTMTLPHALSADGARYANPDESFVFWNKGNGAFITEQGTTTYSGCVTK
jgi:membrane-bound inhibitor of C-type lysozyme